MSAFWTDLLTRFASRRILVVGDVMLDRYWVGEATRISPEAPVPIVRRQRCSSSPGGAGNVALNILALSATPMLVAVVGDDNAGAELREVLINRGVSADNLFVDPGRSTTVKTRVIANKQQVVRLDEEDLHCLAADQESRVLEVIQSTLTSCDCAVLSDYAKGFITPSLATAIISMARNCSIPVVVDPKGADATRYRGATLIKPNRTELSVLTGMPIRCHSEALHGCEQLSKLLPDTVILCTEGADGMIVHMPGREFVHFPTRALEVFDVTGAGDTVAAVTALAIASGADYPAAAHLANSAAGVVVGESGCGTVSVDRLFSQLSDNNLELEELPQIESAHLITQ